jgi:Lamin Tail Domain/FlgD Ig-like domain
LETFPSSKVLSSKKDIPELTQAKIMSKVFYCYFWQMKETIIFLLLFACSGGLRAQLQDNFEDGNFNNSPTWSGDDASYIVDNQILRLNAGSAGTAYLSTPVSIANSSTWSFWIQLDFNPSATGNFPKIFLSADNSNLSGDLNGYFIRIGESNANDAFELYRQEGSTEIFLHRFFTEGEMGATSSNLARLLISRSDSGLWSFAADYSGGFCFVDEGSVSDNTFTTGSHFGLYCQYTVSNIDNFAFDDFYVDLPLPGNAEPLALESLSPIAIADVQLLFSQTLDQAAAETTDNYDVLNSGGTSIGHPATATVDISNNRLVHLDLSNLSVNSNETYTILVSNLSDCNGNSIGPNNSLSFQIILTEPAEAFDILINEIFAAPSSSVGALPNAEFVELYNRSDKAINLEGFRFSDAASEKILSTFVMPPLSYLLVCSSDNEAFYAPYGTVMGIDGFPALNNSGDDLTLTDNNGVVLHQAFYTPAWYQDEDKAAGGWSLELGNPELYCQGESNWSASNNPDGGTPGTQNSAFNNTPDTEGPKLLGATPINDHQLRLFFNEILSEALTVNLFQLSGVVGAVENVLLELPGKTSILLDIAAPFFQNNTSYTVSLQNGLTDCSGNGIDAAFNTATFTYFISQPAEAYDILINEIFADPTPAIGLPDAEYLELYNRSNKNINLENFILADLSDEIVLPYYLLRAGAYVIVYLNGSGSFGAYGDTLALDDFVGLGNTEDDLILLNPAGDIIHAVQYNIGWYQDSGKSEGGWSLEMINPNDYCNVSNNWRASVNPTGGTPGNANSVLDNTPDESPLDLICAYPVSATEIRLYFNKAVDAEALLENFSMEGFSINSLELNPPLFQTATLQFSPALTAGDIYTLRAQSALNDCRGNSVGQFNEVRVALPDVIAAQDIIINEVLSNPVVGGTDFVELYNRSNKVLDPATLFIASRDDNDSIASPESITALCLLFPDDYLVLTENVLNIRQLYNNTSAFAFTETNLPTYEDNEGTVVLYLPELTTALVVDEFAYSDALHYPLLSDKNGVSLERINPEALTQSADNWHSAAAAVGYATPTYQNSQFLGNNSSTNDDFLWLDNSRFSPDNDGFEDFLQIQYALDRPGYTANIGIYDAKGRLVKRLTENELLPTAGALKWDGVNDDGERARTGVHVLEAKLLHPDGDVREYRLGIVVASRL